MFLEDITARAIPPAVPNGMTAAQWPAYREKMLSLFATEQYGAIPPAPREVHVETVLSQPREWAGKAEHREVRLGFDTPGGPFSFPVHLVLPDSERPLPLVVYISFTPYPIEQYGPIEEIVDHGYAIATFCYTDITADKDDSFSSGLAALYPRTGGGSATWGKISMWAFAASRVMDHVRTLGNVDASRIYVAGHSRLGKTALWCGANDQRFAGVAANCSGCSGVAVSRGKQGEHIADIVNRFPHWFCANYAKYMGNEQSLPFEQSTLVAMVAPRPFIACDAQEDIWCDPNSEYISLYIASAAYELLSVPGFIAPAEYPSVGSRLLDGNLGFGLRAGTHFLSRHDWVTYLDFFLMKAKAEKGLR